MYVKSFPLLNATHNLLSGWHDQKRENEGDDPTVDTEVVLAVSAAHTMPLTSCGLHLTEERTLHTYQLILLQLVLEKKTKALPLYHVLTGCNTVSGFCWTRQSNSVESMKDYENWYLIWRGLLREMNLCKNNYLPRFVVLLYYRTSRHIDVNQARKHLFTKKNRALDEILEQHIRWAVHQGCHHWGQSTQARPIIPSHTEWGWERDVHGNIRPLWTTLP